MCFMMSVRDIYFYAICFLGWEDDPADHPNLSFCNHPADDCEHANCGANGRCVDGLLQYTCQCDDGHYGEIPYTPSLLIDYTKILKYSK